MNVALWPTYCIEEVVHEIWMKEIFVVHSHREGDMAEIGKND